MTDPMDKAERRLALTGIVMIIAYSVVMMNTGGSSAFAWLLLALGIGLIVWAGRLRSRRDDP